MLLAIDGAALAIHLTFEPSVLARADSAAAHPCESFIRPDPCEPCLEPSGLAPSQLPTTNAVIDALLLAVFATIDSCHRDRAQTENEYCCDEQASYLSHAFKPLF